MKKAENKSNDETHQSTVIFLPSGRRGYVNDNSTIMEAAQELGVDLACICGGQGTCGKCKVEIKREFLQAYGINSLMENLSPPNEVEEKLLSPGQRQDGYRLACQARVYGDVVVVVPEESRTGEQVIRKQVKKRATGITNPAVKKYPVQMSPATLEDNSADWERLRTALGVKYGLRNISIDYTVLRSLQEVLRGSNWEITASVWMDKEVIKVEPGTVERGYGLAADIGTTTVAVYVCDLTTGEVVATGAAMNPQVAYGEDVMARIASCIADDDNLAHMNRLIVKCFNQLAGQAAAKARITRKDIVDMTVVGNTCMHHIFLNLNPRYLGKVPFSPGLQSPMDIKARELGITLSPGAYIHFLPVEAGFVGADNVGVLISEELHNQDDMALAVDIGTNGELVLGNREKLISCSCATGPALEGAQIKFGMRAAPGAIEKIKIAPDTKEVSFKVIGKKGWNVDMEDTGAKGICGSGIIDAIAQLFTAGVINHTGRFRTDMKHPRLRVNNGEPEFIIAWARETSIDRNITICQKDLRNVQLVKGAMYAGAKVMMSRLAVDKLDKIILAGAFGSYIDKESAAIIGFFPDCALENVHSVGNAAGDGARIALLNVDRRIEAKMVARQVEYVELALVPDFERHFTEAMWFPHMKDSFLNLDHLLTVVKTV